MFIRAFCDSLNQVDSIFRSKVMIKQPQKLPKNSTVLTFFGASDKVIEFLRWSILMEIFQNWLNEL